MVSADATRTSPFGLGLDDSSRWSFWMHTVDNDSTSLIRATATTPAVANSWVQLTAVYDATAHTMKLYVNGVLATTTTSVPAIYNATGNLTVGRHQWMATPTGYFLGDVDDTRVYNRALTAAEIAGTDTIAYRYQLDGVATPTDVSATGEASVSITRPRTAGARSPCGPRTGPTT